MQMLIITLMSDQTLELFEKLWLPDEVMLLDS